MKWIFRLSALILLVALFLGFYLRCPNEATLACCFFEMCEKDIPIEGFVKEEFAGVRVKDSLNLLQFLNGYYKDILREHLIEGQDIGASVYVYWDDEEVVNIAGNLFFLFWLMFLKF